MLIINWSFQGLLGNVPHFLRVLWKFNGYRSQRARRQCQLKSFFSRVFNTVPQKIWTGTLLLSGGDERPWDSGLKGLKMKGPMVFGLNKEPLWINGRLFPTPPHLPFYCRFFKSKISLQFCSSHLFQQSLANLSRIHSFFVVLYSSIWEEDIF